MKQAYIDRGWSLRYPKAGETFNGIPVITADSLTSAAPYITTTTASNVTTTTSGSSSNSISSSSSGNQFWNITNNDDKIAANSNSVTSSGYSGMHRHSPVDLNVIDDDLNGDIVMAFAKDDEPVPDIHNIDITFEQKGVSEAFTSPVTDGDGMEIDQDFTSDQKFQEDEDNKGSDSDASSNIMLTGRFEGHEDTKCDCCRDETVYDDDALVYCDSCDVCVHQSCYDIKSSALDEESWYCDPCAADADTENLQCVLCPLKGGALKRVSDKELKNRWVHVLCSNYIPGCYVEDMKIKKGN